MAVDGPMLTTRQINRSVLARQLLLERADLDIPSALQRIGGLQTQYAPSGYVGLWSRLAGFERGALTRALEDRSVVQGTLMRSTIHMVAARDYWAICAGIRASRREWWERIARSRKLGDVPHERMSELLRNELAGGPRPSKDLIAAMEHAGLPKALWEGAGLWLDMVRVPPSGTWERRRADLYGLAEQWVRPVKKPSERAGLQLLVTQYLGAFGPAPLDDAANWAGVPKRRLEPIVAKMTLRTFRDETNAVVLDLADGELPDPDTPAPVRLLPTWDATLLAHRRRSGILPESVRSKVFDPAYPQSVGTVLVDGTVAATWTWRTDHVAIDELRALTRSERRQVNDESARLTAFYNG